MKKFTESQATFIVTMNGGEVKSKIITSKNRLKGLKTCSALDFLCNYCGYIANL